MNMNIAIDETGEKTRLQNMRVSQVKSMTFWGSHKDRLFADYDFPKYTNDEIIDWYKTKTKGKRILIAITDLENLELVGYMTLRKISGFFKTAELGIVLNPDKIEKGYGSDAMKTLTRWFFTDLKYEKLNLTVAMYNDRAYRVYKKVGFKSIGRVYESFDNDEVDPFEDKKYENISKYFKRQGGVTYVNCIKMQMRR